jgi:hypothetical protein
MGQHFAETVNVQLHRTNGHWVFQYPNLQNAGGITASLSAGFNKPIIPANHENLNWHFRIFSLAMLLISSLSLRDGDPQKSRAENSSLSDYC